MNDSYEARMSKKYGFSSTDKGLEETQQENPETKEDLLDKDQDSLMIPISAWEAVLGQLGNIHEASQEMAEARERAAKAEEVADLTTFLVSPRCSYISGTIISIDAGVSNH